MIEIENIVNLMEDADARRLTPPVYIFHPNNMNDPIVGDACKAFVKAGRAFVSEPIEKKEPENE